MFFTLQGEGPYAGAPAFFIRLTKCNLACSFCDTFFDDGEWMTYGEILNKANTTIKAYWTDRNLPVPDWVDPVNFMSDSKYHFPGVVLVMTGGEPLLQDNIGPFLEYASRVFGKTQIESNGIPDTVVPECTTLVCSPKCAEKDGKATKYFKPSKTILERADCLKFVMSADKDSPYNEVPDWAHDWKKKYPEKEIYCSPMNIYNDFPQKIKLLRAEKGVITMAERSTVDETIDRHPLLDRDLHRPRIQIKSTDASLCRSCVAHFRQQYFLCSHGTELKVLLQDGHIFDILLQLSP